MNWSALLQCILNQAEIKVCKWYAKTKIKFKLWKMHIVSLRSGLSEIAKSIVTSILKILIIILLLITAIDILQPIISAYLSERNLTKRMLL